MNPFAGEVTLTINGQAQVLKLTLGALAELEDALESGSLIDLVQRFENSSYSTRDVLMLIFAGLRGGGWGGVASDLMQADISGGPVAAAQAAALLLARAFTVPQS